VAQRTINHTAQTRAKHFRKRWISSNSAHFFGDMGNYSNQWPWQYINHLLIEARGIRFLARRLTLLTRGPSSKSNGAAESTGSYIGFIGEHNISHIKHTHNIQYKANIIIVYIAEKKERSHRQPLRVSVMLNLSLFYTLCEHTYMWWSAGSRNGIWAQPCREFERGIFMVVCYFYWPILFGNLPIQK
jgi:hypothetical protein